MKKTHKKCKCVRDIMNKHEYAIKTQTEQHVWSMCRVTSPQWKKRQSKVRSGQATVTLPHGSKIWHLFCFNKGKFEELNKRRKEGEGRRSAPMLKGSGDVLEVRTTIYLLTYCPLLHRNCWSGFKKKISVSFLNCGHLFFLPPVTFMFE